MKYDNLEPVWLWRIKAETKFSTGKQKLTSQVAPNGQVIKVPEPEILTYKSDLCFDIRKVIEYHQIKDEKDRTSVLIENVGGLTVFWSFEDFDKELRRRLVLLEQDGVDLNVEPIDFGGPSK